MVQPELITITDEQESFRSEGSDVPDENSVPIEHINEVSDIKNLTEKATTKTILSISPIGTNLPSAKIRRILKEYDEFSVISKDSLFLIIAATVSYLILILFVGVIYSIFCFKSI